MGPFDTTARTDVADARLVCGAQSSYGPEGARCNNHTTVPLRVGAGNDMTFDAPGWSVMFDGPGSDQPIIRCPRHAQTPGRRAP